MKTRLGDRFGQRCAVTARGRMNSARVEFEDGLTVITSRNYIRKRNDWDWQPPVEGE